ncbi:MULTISPECIES: DUF4286 family protein [unclassified Pseudofrankia]|uniref:DUF4286 family protein n=1 Tax=unclassified Pseudofrankia TaxID=2994372 RepID=UPI0008DA3394|nr:MULTISPECIES: DUF4286 family protein [unclassified Pseudofrankia]MDT3441418.1 hypothetical protein [Pseudofrankia sp. BMG5.37]OHV49071.1 hypothetical protein BCD48_13410 [Pseudofrankia sp. BMG5.36]
MAKGIMLVQASPASPEVEDEFNRWYDEDHLPDLLTIPGFVAARRFRLREGGHVRAAEGTPRYLAIYEIEADDLDAALRAMRTRPDRGKVSDALGMNPPPVTYIYELLTEVTEVTA